MLKNQAYSKQFVAAFVTAYVKRNIIIVTQDLLVITENCTAIPFIMNGIDIWSPLVLPELKAF